MGSHMKRIAVIGAGVAGLGAAHRLSHTPGDRAVTLFEAGAYFGGHANTVDVTLPGPDGQPLTHGVDTGFLVFNERTYPHLIQLFADLGVPTAKSDMSFSVQIPDQAQGLAGLRPGLEWCGSSLDTVFAQRGNIVSPASTACAPSWPSAVKRPPCSSPLATSSRPRVSARPFRKATSCPWWPASGPAPCSR